MEIFEKIAMNLMRPINPSLILVLGLYTVTWGLWLVNPFWSVFTQAPLYAYMATLGPEWAWGVVAIITGLFTLRGAIKPSYHNLHIGSFAAAMFWLIIAIFYFLSDASSTGGISSFTFFIYAAIVCVNVKVNRWFYDNDEE